MKPLKTIPALAIVILSANFASAEDYTWTGGSETAPTDWSDATNWAPKIVPTLTGADNANLGGEAIYDAANGDFLIGTGSTFTINNGGSWEQTNGIAWMKMNGGALVINSGGSFNAGTMQQLQVNTGATFTINTGGNFTSTATQLVASGDGQVVINGTYNSGSNNLTFTSGTTLTVGSGGSLTTSSLTLNSGSTANFSGEVNLSSTLIELAGTTTMNVTAGATLTTTGNLIITSDDALFNMTGGTVNIGEFKPNANKSIHVLGGVVNATLISFDATEGQGIIELGAARINLSKGGFAEGIFTVGGDDYINFTSISSEVFIDNLSEAGANLLLTDGRLRYNDAIGNIISTAQGDGYLFTVDNIPEASTYAGLVGLLALSAVWLNRRKS